jgi:hypothetical protein
MSEVSGATIAVFLSRKVADVLYRSDIQHRLAMTQYNNKIMQASLFDVWP